MENNNNPLNEEMTPAKTGSASKIVIAVIAIIIVIGIAVWLVRKPAPEAMPAKQEENLDSAKAPEATENKQYKDGTYTAVGNYESPAGPEEIGVTVTLENNIIKSAQVEAKATNKKSKFMQDAFVTGFSEQVVGKKIDEVSLGVVNGSSLTPKGFMDALEKIETQAS